MKKIFTPLYAALLLLPFTACNNNTGDTAKLAEPATPPTPAVEAKTEPKAESGAILVTYFSKTGNTKAVAEMIAKNTGGTIHQIEPEVAYPEDYQASVDVARKEKDTNARPKLKASDLDMTKYGTVFVGYPNWWSSMPMPMFTFLESYDFTGKQVVPFCTHGGGGAGTGFADIQKSAKGATLLDGIAILGKNAAESEDTVKEWLAKLEFVK